MEVVGVSELLAGEVLWSHLGILEIAVGASEIVIPIDEVLCSCLGFILFDMSCVHGQPDEFSQVVPATY